jgi:hypothetical protein
MKFKGKHMTIESNIRKPFCGMCGSSNEVMPVTKKTPPLKPKQVDIPTLDLAKLSNDAKPLKKRKIRLKPQDNITIKQALRKFTLSTIKE